MGLVTEMMLLNTEESGRELRIYYDIKKIHDDNLHGGYASVHSCFKYTVQKQWTFQIYIQGVTPTVWFEYQTQNKTKHVKVNVFCW